MKKTSNEYQILIGIIPTFSENFIQINVGLDHFIIDSLQKWILEAAIDRLEIQS